MQYYKASRIGQERSRIAQMKLFDYTGYAMLTYTVKKDQSDFEPVGVELLVAKMVMDGEAILFLCDVDGYVKAQSKPLAIAKVNEIYIRMQSDGFMEYKGKIKTVT
jgi:hypothetical protein